ncbi:MAG: DUF3999 domain-containing protein [Pseudomonadota bacterium]
MKYLLMAMFFFVPVMHAQAEEMRTMDFAAGYYLEIENDGPFHSLELPADVYHTVRRADLGDIRIFNSGGEVVPHGLRYVSVQPETVRQKESVPFFPLYESTMAAGQADLTLHVLRNSTGTIVNINSEPAPGDHEPRITGYLLDLSGFKWPVGELAFQWKAGQDSSVFNIHLQHSDDLQHWNSLVATAILVDLQHGGERIEKRTVPLAYKPQRYLHLTWQDSGPPLHLTQVTGASQIIQSLQRRQWVDLANGSVHSDGKELVVDYQTTARLPASSAQLAFQDKNPLARIALQSRENDKEPWRTRCEQVFYSLSVAASEVRNEPCSFPSTSDRQWRALVREDGAGIGVRRQAPNLQLGWMPSELVFVGRGAPPFLLAFGSAKLEHQGKVAENGMILQTIGITQINQKVGAARLGKRIELGGDKALQPLPPPQPWKKWLLWAILVLGVSLMATMARSLIKEMNKRAENRATEEP